MAEESYIKGIRGTSGSVHRPLDVTRSFAPLTHGENSHHVDICDYAAT